MRATVSLEQRFARTPDGAVWTETAFDPAFWQPYLSVFDEVRVVARVREADAAGEGWRRADAPGVTFDGLPHWIGPAQYLRAALRVRRRAAEIVRPGEAYVLRVPSAIGGRLWRRLAALGHPYGVEVVGDPWDVFAPGSLAHPLSPVLRRWFARELRRQCARATGASYVTERALQRRYPCPAFSTNVSTIRLDDAWLLRAPRVYAGPGRRVVFVGSLEVLYKAPDVLLDAVARVAEAMPDVELVMVGDGRRRPELEASPAARRLGDRVRFLGALPAGERVRAELDAADLFVLPSRTEGLPRAMVEAMARGLPCVGADVGGIPELVPPDLLVRPGDAGELARRIEALLRDPARMTEASARNLEVARGYASSVLLPRRTAFYRHLRERTEAWEAP
ncbi:MAG: glycosyltransferase family 4 protein [Myxococcota bacterium]